MLDALIITEEDYSSMANDGLITETPSPYPINLKKPRMTKGAANNTLELEALALELQLELLSL